MSDTPSRDVGPYACPQTHDPLDQVGDVLQTSDAVRQYEIRDGIPCLLQYEPTEEASVRSLMTRLNDIARNDGWQAAISEIYGDRPYVTDESRADCLDLLGLTSEHTVLEIGASLGQFTVPLGRRVKQVYGLEVVPGQAQFTAERCRQDGVTNVQIACGGDDCRLPYRSGAFDAVILNLVLEWCHSRHTDERAPVSQQRMLDECCRVLRDQGQLYLSTKNRYALRLLIGKKDEHAWHLRFGSALPRWLLKMILNVRGKSDTQGYLHSYKALRRMLRRAGFESAQSYWAVPEMRYPSQYVRTDSAFVRAARRQRGFVQGESRSTNLLMRFVPAPMVKYVTPGLLFIARNPSRMASAGSKSTN